jgi:septum formation protein
MNIPLILASNSPRRRELLAQVGWSFTVDPADVDEQMLAEESPEYYAVRVAQDKAQVAARRAGSGIVIAADTIVVLDNEVLGKPRDVRDATRMLTMLSGREHRVITGVAVMDAATGSSESRAVSTRVRFRELRKEAIDAYVATGEPMDKAGAYGIQERGALLVERIEGCYYNVVGLPLAVLAEMLEGFAVDSMLQSDQKTDK